MIGGKEYWKNTAEEKSEPPTMNHMTTGEQKMAECRSKLKTELYGGAAEGNPGIGGDHSMRQNGHLAQQLQPNKAPDRIAKGRSILNQRMGIARCPPELNQCQKNEQITAKKTTQATLASGTA